MLKSFTCTIKNNAINKNALLLFAPKLYNPFKKCLNQLIFFKIQYLVVVLYYKIIFFVISKEKLLLLIEKKMISLLNSPASNKYKIWLQKKLNFKNSKKVKNRLYVFTSLVNRLKYANFLIFFWIKFIKNKSFFLLIIRIK